MNYGSLGGRVVDPGGAVVPRAAVTARHKETNVTLEAFTGQDGRFRFPYLRVGPYEVVVHLIGFTDAVRTVNVTVGSAFELPIALALAGVEETVTVSAEAPILDVARTQIAGTVSRTEASALPMNGRNFLDLALLVPGVALANVASTQLFAETSAVPGSGLSVASQRNFSNNFIVDGFSANDDAAGLIGMPYSVDAVDQFQVVTSGGQAELGRALGGYVNVVTRSGTNAVQGDVYEYLRDDRLNRPNALSGTKLPMHQNQYGGSLGGPIRRNRTFFFANAERLDLDQSGLTTISAANVEAINAKLSAVGYAGSPVATGVYPNPVRTTNILAKVDHLLTGRSPVSVRYQQYAARASNSRGAGGLGAPAASAGLDNIDRSVGLGQTLSLSARTVNELRVQYAHGDLAALPTDAIGPGVSIAGVATFGTFSGSPTGRVNSLFELVDNLSHQAGAHALRAGVDVVYNDDAITYPRSTRGQYAFSSLKNFLAGTYNNAGFTQTFGASTVSQTSPTVGVYAQDEWKVKPTVTINAGLRYDLQFLRTIHADRNNVGPRVGFAWSPSALGRTVVRASAGLFYDRVPLRPLANALLSAGNTADVARLRQVVISLSPGQTGAPTFPGILSAAVASTTLPNLTTMDSYLQHAQSRQGSLEIEHQFAAAATLSAGYQYVRGRNLIAAINQNVPACVASGNNNGCRPNPAFANNSQYSSRGTSTYHGLHLSFVQRPARWGYYRVSYALSKAEDNVGPFFFSAPIDPFDLSKDWGRSDGDQRHRLVVSAAVSAPTGPARGVWSRVARGFQLSGQARYSSALPLNVTSGVTTIQGTAGRPIANGAFILRNAGTGPDSFSLSVRLSRVFDAGPWLRLEGLVEGFNLTNRMNVVTMNGNFGSGDYPTSPAATFGQPTAVGEPRSWQVGIRFRLRRE